MRILAYFIFGSHVSNICASSSRRPDVSSRRVGVAQSRSRDIRTAIETVTSRVQFPVGALLPEDLVQLVHSLPRASDTRGINWYRHKTDRSQPPQSDPRDAQHHAVVHAKRASVVGSLLITHATVGVFLRYVG